MSTQEHENYCLARFCALAKAGGSPAASTGENTARRLATALAAIGDDMALLDEDAIHGFHNFCLLAHGPWHTDDQKHHCFEIIRQATS